MINIIFSILYQTGPKHAKRGVTHSSFNFWFGNPNSSAANNAIKNNMAIFEKNQDILSSQIRKILNFVNLTYVETNTN